MGILVYEHLMQLNEHQLSILKTPGGLIAVIAGAGTGKTTTLIELILKLYYENKIPLERMFITTFTNKAGADLKEKLSKRLKINKEFLNNLWVGTSHSLGYRYLKTIKKLKVNMVLESEAKYFIKNIYKQILEEEGLSEEEVNFTETYRNIDYKRNKNCSWEKISQYPTFCQKVYDKYQLEKSQQNVVDFTDILVLFDKYLTEDKEFCNRFDWGFYDEAQDLNHLQFSIVSKIAYHKNVVCIGDEKQSIYRFRGATPELFQEKISQANYTYPLAYNYRSSKDIVDVANLLLGYKDDKYKNQELIETKPKFQKPNVIYCNSIPQQLLYQIKSDIQSGIPPQEIAVLGRSVKAMNLQELQVLLKQNGISYVVRGGDDKLQSLYVQNFLSLLKSLCSPNKISFINTLSMLPGVGAKTANKLANTILLNNNEVMSISGQNVYSKSKAFKDYVELSEVYDKKDLILKSIDFIYEHYLLSKYDREQACKRKDIIFKSFYENLMKYEHLSEGVDSLFMDEEDEGSQNKVIISTIHQSKALQWESVHIVNFHEGSIPMIKEDTDEEEEFCLAYVAITRAIKKLSMYIEYQSYNGTKNKISPYLKYILKNTGEKYLNLRMLDVPDELSWKEGFFNKLKEI